MANATLTRGHGYWIEKNAFHTNKDQDPADWTWYIGQWNQNYWDDAGYGAGCVEYYVPNIDDGLLSRTVSIPIAYYGNTGMCEVYAVLSTTAPDGNSLDFRYGPSGGVISNVEKTTWKNTGVSDTTFNFTLKDSVGISGKTIYLYLYLTFGGYGTSGSNSSIVTRTFYDGEITYGSPYKLSVSKDAGSTITVNRTASGSGSTGNIKNNAALYYGDKLKITFAPKQNYKLLTTEVNGKAFVSGNTVDVTKNISVKATSQPLASEVGATDADIESLTSISIMPYDSSYVHTLRYTFGNLSGIIVDNTRLTSIAWSVPSSFYNEIPNSVSGICKIVCDTYRDGIIVGSSSCDITVRASYEKCAPRLSGSVEDTNANTVALTQNKYALVKYLSNVLCTISAAGQNGATIVSREINGVFIPEDTHTIQYASTDIEKFVFVVVDSRGYSNQLVVTPEIVPYIKLTINPILSRQSMTSDDARLSFNGNFYGGHIGSSVNTLQIKYRYKLSSDPVYGQWIYVDPDNYITTSSRYYSQGSITLTSYDGSTSGFHYQKSYDFQIEATDGVGSTTLCTVRVTDILKRGEPVFDWGENDFNVNVSLMLNRTNILDIMYPVGFVYITMLSSMPDFIANIGIWESIQTGIPDTYAWKRVS